MSGKLYLARNKSVAARLLGDEMMLMSGEHVDVGYDG
jgi:hypothetical protein